MLISREYFANLFYLLILLILLMTAFPTAARTRVKTLLPGPRAIFGNKLIPLSRRCKEMAAEPLRMICSSSYPLEVKIKYKDQMVQAGMPYSVYAPRLDKTPSQYMLSFRPSNVHKCPLIKVTHQNQIQCVELDSTDVIPQRNSVLHCFNMSIEIVVDLVVYCMEHKQGPEWSVDELELELSMFHYSNVNYITAGAGRLDGWLAGSHGWRLAHWQAFTFWW